MIDDYRKEQRIHDQQLAENGRAEYNLKQGLYSMNEYEQCLADRLKIVVVMRDVSTDKISYAKGMEEVMKIMGWEQ